MKRTQGLTIVELLVVIALVGVLLAIALPALDQSRQRSQAADCASNLRQIGLMINDYQAANANRLPDLVNRQSLLEPGPAIDTLLTSPDSVNLFLCPADTSIAQRTGTSYFWNPAASGMTLDKLFPANAPNDALPLLNDKQPLHPELREGMNMLYADCVVPGQLHFITPGR